VAGLGSLAGITPGSFFTGKTAKAVLYPMDLTDNVVAGDGREFQYWPETIDDTKGVEYNQKQIPGGSHPLLQWIAGGARELSFTAVFSRDHQADPSQGGVNAAPSDVQYREDHLTRNVDLNAAVAWFRQHLYPGYSDNEIRVNPPSKLLLYLPNTILGPGKLPSMECVMTKCDVGYRMWFPDGTPRLVELGLSFMETVQVGGRVKFVGRAGLATTASTYGAKKLSR
jgi:hypothetical protein